ncbi:MAG: hypothetical protein QXH20_07195 [Candidatus Bathyarchaeia archaeon]
MNANLLAILSMTIIALLSIGYSYACKNGGVNINPNKNFDVAFISVTTSDNEAEINVATIHAQITHDQNAIDVYLMNAYPGYEAYITYTIQNIDKIPARFDSLTIKNPNPEALLITTTDHTYTWLQPGQTVQGKTTIRILETAEENQAYTFQIIMGLSSNKEEPRSMGFWKQQFTAALTETESQLQIAPATLENYLDQISVKSEVFEFQGSQKEKFQQALKILDLPKTANMEAKLKAQLLALWLNYIARWTEGYTLYGMTAYNIMQGAEQAIKNSQTNDYKYWKDLCEKFNNLGEK